MRPVTINDVEYLSFRLAKELMGFDEPIPPFTTRFPNILESCVSTPFQRFAKRDAYRGFVAKAAILFYFLIKNHPFKNGNKRIAMTTLLVFLYKNKKWLKADNWELYRFAMWVAESPAEFKEEVVKSIEKFLKEHLVPLK